MRVFEGTGVDEVWQSAIIELQENSRAKTQSSRQGKTQELLQVTFVINDPRQRWLLSRQPGVNPAFAIAEVIWILNGRQDASFLTAWNSHLPKYAGNAEFFHGAYGYRLKRHFGIDQLRRAYDALHNNPDSRQVVLQIWDPVVDLPSPNGEPVNPDIPCNILSMLKVRNNNLEWTQIARSNDIYRGIPYNFIQFTTLQEILAGWLGVGIGTYTHISDSLHFYTNDAKEFKSVALTDSPTNSDDLRLPHELSETTFTRLADIALQLIQQDLTSQDIMAITVDLDLPSQYCHWIYILAAEAARRRKWFEIANEIINRCQNTMLQAAWQGWNSRFIREI